MELIQSTPSSRLLTGDSVPPPPSYVTHYLRLYPEKPNVIHRVTLLESRTTIEQGTTGLRTWPAAYALAAWLGKYPGLPRPFIFPFRCLTTLYYLIERVLGKRVLELGSGVGYLGLVIAAIQLNGTPNQEGPESSIWLTDVNKIVLSRCRDNLNLPCSASQTFLTGSKPAIL